MTGLPLSRAALAAGDLVRRLQRRLVDRLEGAARTLGSAVPFAAVTWRRDGGRHGGGRRLVACGTPVYQQASVNVSVVHYADLPSRPLASASALSCIVHPDNPHAPSMHLHISWTELKDGAGSWRVMADLNPSLPRDPDTAAFAAALREAAPAQYAEAAAQGDAYFTIPALGRHRGATHFYLEGFATGDAAADAALAERVGEAVIACYGDLVETRSASPPSDADRAAQRAYHTVYLFQVLTLDRGTTSGLLVHDQNDAGILGSLPARIDRALLASWRDRVPPPQDALVAALVAAIDGPIDRSTRLRLAGVVRAHYRRHPEALALQAAGFRLPAASPHRGR